MTASTSSPKTQPASDSVRECSAFYPASLGSSTSDNAGAGASSYSTPVPVQFYDGFVEPKTEVWRRA